MAVQRHEIVPGEESDIHDEPHLAGRRLTVRVLAAAVEERELHPTEVAERYDVPVADVYRALAYFHDHPEEMERVERQRREAERQALERGAMTISDLREDVEDDAE